MHNRIAKDDTTQLLVRRDAHPDIFFLGSVRFSGTGSACRAGAQDDEFASVGEGGGRDFPYHDWWGRGGGSGFGGFGTGFSEGEGREEGWFGWWWLCLLRGELLSVDIY